MPYFPNAFTTRHTRTWCQHTPRTDRLARPLCRRIQWQKNLAQHCMCASKLASDDVNVCVQVEWEKNVLRVRLKSKDMTELVHTWFVLTFLPFDWHLWLVYSEKTESDLILLMCGIILFERHWCCYVINTCVRSKELLSECFWFHQDINDSKQHLQLCFGTDRYRYIAWSQYKSLLWHSAIARNFVLKVQLQEQPVQVLEPVSCNIHQTTIAHVISPKIGSLAKSHFLTNQVPSPLLHCRRCHQHDTAYLLSLVAPNDHNNDLQ